MLVFFFSHYFFIFLQKTRTGFYVEPQLGYVRVVHVDVQWTEGKYGDGVAAAFETGYSLEVG
jgi:hypothetical protein